LTDTGVVNSSSYAKGHFAGLKRFLLWDYPRESSQYGVLVAIILAFIFLTPREIFRDQPKANSIVRIRTEHGLDVYWFEPDLINPLPEAARASQAETMLRSKFGKKENVLRLEPIFDSEHDVKGYMAVTKP
jgi:hypothetical protein